MRRLVSISVALALAATAQSAQAAYDGEVLLMPLPQGFKLGFSAVEGRTKTAEFVPHAETVDDWSQMLSQNIFNGRGGADPDDLPSRMTSGWEAACPGGEGRRVRRTTENGYEASLWRFVCPHNPATGKPESMWLKVISAADSVYSVQFSYRRAASDDMARTAMAYLDTVSVCDRRTSAHPCPAGVEGALPQ